MQVHDRGHSHALKLYQKTDLHIKAGEKSRSHRHEHDRGRGLAEVAGDHLDVRAKSEVKLKIRQDEDGDIDIRFEAEFKARVKSFGPNDDRSGVTRSVFKLSESIEARLHIEAGDAGQLPDLADAISRLSAGFAGSLNAFAERFTSDARPRAGELISDVRDAFAGLLSGLFDIFRAAGDPPALGDGGAGDSGADPDPGADPGSTSDSTTASDTADPVIDIPLLPDLETTEPGAEEAGDEETDESPTRLGIDVSAPGDTERPGAFELLRRDLHVEFLTGFRALARSLTQGAGIEPRDDDDHHDHPQRGIRFEYEIQARQTLRFNLIDTRA